MLIENGISRIAGFFDLAIVPIKTAHADGATARRQPSRRGGRKIALIEEAGGVSVEKLLLSGAPAAVQSKVIEMIQSRCKMVLEGFPLEEIAAWCFTHNYRWR